LRGKGLFGLRISELRLDGIFVGPGDHGMADARLVSKGEFTCDCALNMSGFHFPIMDIRVGNFRLETTDMSSDKEFLTFESKCLTISTWTPFQIVYSDVSSEEVSTETGLHRENMSRVFCKACHITRDGLTFKGYDKQIGQVTFTGKIDPNFLATQANDKTFTNVSFSYWGRLI